MWLRLLSVDALGPEREFLLTQEGDIPVALEAVGGSGSRAGIREKTWVSGRAPGLHKLSDEVLLSLSAGARCRLFAYGPADATAI